MIETVEEGWKVGSGREWEGDCEMEWDRERAKAQRIEDVTY